MNVHLFGASSFPSCTSFCLKQVTKDYGEKYADAVISTLKGNFYVSDCLKSLWSTKESKELVPQLTNLLADAGFRLHKWMSKDQDTMKVISPGDRASSIADLNLDHLPVDRALAIKWDVQEDLLFLTQFSRRSLYCKLNTVYDTKFRRFAASHKVLGAGG